MYPALEIDQVSKYYKGSKETDEIAYAVNNVSLIIPKGQIVGFLGANGAGKTTTIKMICGLVTPTCGSIKINGYNIATERFAAMKQIGAVLEGTRNIYWQLSPWDNLIYFGQLKGVNKEILSAKVETLLKELNLWHRANDPVSTFSRGMQQKVAIACALIADPEIILLDEPTLGLDVQASNLIKKLILNLAKRDNKTVVLTTHQLEIAQQLCDRIVIINKGKIIADKPTSQLLTHQKENFYKITVAGKVNEAEKLLPHMIVEHDQNLTIFTGAVKDQQQLFADISALQDKDLSLISVTPLHENLEQIFIDIVEKQESI